MAFDYQTHLTTHDSGVPVVDFSDRNEMAPYLDAPKAMYLALIHIDVYK